LEVGAMLKRCPVCGANLERFDAMQRAARNVARVQRWQAKHRDQYNAYQREYQRKRRARRREANGAAAKP
jgi:hypothetical protein